MKLCPFQVEIRVFLCTGGKGLVPAFKTFKIREALGTEEKIAQEAQGGKGGRNARFIDIILGQPFWPPLYESSFFWGGNGIMRWSVVPGKSIFSSRHMAAWALGGFLLIPSLRSQTTWFSCPTQNIPTYAGRGLFTSGDFDGDGDLDLFEFNLPPMSGRTLDSFGRDRVYLNDGYGGFRELEGAVPKAYFYEYYTVRAGDIDRDGDVDVLFTGMPGFFWVYLNRGKGRFSLVKGSKIGVTFYDRTGFVLKDFDGDGDLDIFGMNMLFFNDGKGRFTDVSKSNLPALKFPGSPLAGDYDGDGDIDLLLFSPVQKTYRMFFLENQGKGVFKDATQGKTDSIMTPYAFLEAEDFDFDGDGKLDLLMADSSGSVVLFNQGKGVFKWGNRVHFVKVGGNQKNVPGQFLFLDIDGDGSREIIGFSSSDKTFYSLRAPVDKGGRIRAWKCLSGRRIIELPSSYVTPPARINGGYLPWKSVGGDFDGDGDLDFLISDTKCYLFFNDGKGYFSLKSLSGIPHGPEEPLKELGQLGLFGDLDGDGDLDWVLGVEYNCVPKNRSLLVFFNGGEGKFEDRTDYCLSKASKMTSRGQRLSYLDLHDIDSDGDLDLLAALEYPTIKKIFLNDGHGRFSLGGGGAWLYPGYWMDVDGDGLEDSCQGLYWSKNLGKGFFKYQGRFVSPGLVPKTFGCYPSDVDGDGDVDLLITNLDTNKKYNLYDLIVLENLGKQKWRMKYKANNGVSGYFFVSDLDNDGDPDILFWNGVFSNDGKGRFIYHSLYPNDLLGMVGLFLLRSVGYHVNTVKDLDGDGLPEIVYNAQSDFYRWFPRYQPDPWWGSYVGVAKNLGDFRFRDATREYVGNFGVVGGGNGRIFLEDVDGDGDLDLLGQGEYQGLPQVWFNLHQQTAVSGTWGLGKKGHVEVYGHPGDQVLLMAGRPGKPVKVPGFGTWRLGSWVVPVLTTTLKKDPARTNAVHDLLLPVPKVPALIGAKVRFQSLLYRPGYGYRLTNSDTATVTNL